MTGAQTLSDVSVRRRVNAVLSVFIPAIHLTKATDEMMILVQNERLITRKEQRELDACIAESHPRTSARRIRAAGV